VTAQLTMRGNAAADASALAAADCAPLPDGEASPGYLRHLVAEHAREALGEAFAAAPAAKLYWPR
jgi:hypothetical protein